MIDEQDAPAEMAAILRMSPEALRELLQLPAGSYIDHVQPDEAMGALLLRVRGAGWPVRPGSIIPRTTATCRKSFDEAGNMTAFTIDWGFPKPLEHEA